MQTTLCLLLSLLIDSAVQTSNQATSSSLRKAKSATATKLQHTLTSEHFCEVLNNSRHIKLQALTIDSQQLYLMHDDNLYIIPRANLDTKQNVLYMYDRSTKKRLQPIKWYEHRQLRVSVAEPHNGSNADNFNRHRNMNQADKLAMWHVFALDQKHTRPPMQYNLLLSYVFKGDNDTSYEEYLIDFLKRNMLYDSGRNSTGDPSIDYRYQARHLPFHAVTDGVDTTKGFIFKFDRTDKKAKSTNSAKRVLIDRVYKTPTEADHTDVINFPSVGTSPKGAYLRLVDDGSLTPKRTAFTLVMRDSASRGISKNLDFFHHLPFGFIGPHNEVYLFSEAARRVYRIDYFELNFDVILPQPSIIASRSWLDFFICSPNQKVMKDDSGELTEPSQGEYIELAEKWANRDNEEDSWLTLGLLASLVVAGLFVALVIGVVVLRIRKLRRRRIKELTAILSTATLTTEETSTSTKQSERSATNSRKNQRRKLSPSVSSRVVYIVKKSKQSGGQQVERLLKFGVKSKSKSTTKRLSPAKV